MTNKIGYIIHESFTEAKAKIISEDNSRVVAEAILQDGEAQNRNGRWYHTKDLAREINCERTKELIDAKEFKGEAGHPTEASISRQQTIDPTKVCCRFDKLWMDGNLVKAYVRGTKNELGREFDEDLREGGKKAFSCRALGTIVNEKGKNYVNNFRLITYDHVIFCSHKMAYTTGIVSESANMGNEMIKNESGILIPITNSSVISYIKSESANFKNIFNTFDTLCESISLVDNNTRIRLIAKNGDIIMVNLENYIQNEIMNYCMK